MHLEGTAMLKMSEMRWLSETKMMKILLEMEMKVMNKYEDAELEEVVMQDRLFIFLYTDGRREMFFQGPAFVRYI